jgi:1,4-dihydroxy-2-naphthoate octaprenyltransferase
MRVFSAMARYHRVMQAGTARTSETGMVMGWLLAARPKTLPAAVSPVLVGCAVAWVEGVFNLAVAIAAFMVALLLQIAANFANDVADFHRGADTAERLGPTRVTQSGMIAPRQVEIATAVTLVAAAIPGLYLVARGGPILALIGLLAMLAAVAYTAGPKPFGYLGLGEIFVFLFFGPVAVVGTAYVMSGRVTPLALAASIPMGCLIAAILVVNNLRDIETDRAAGKRTLAVRIGREATRLEYLLFLGIAYLTPVGLWIAGMTGPWVMLSWLTLPVAALLVRQVWLAGGRALNPVLGGTARLCLWFAVAFAAGMVI